VFHKVKWARLVLIVWIMLLPLAESAHAALPYESYSFDSSENRFPVQATYVPERMIGLATGDLKFDSPEDIMIDNQDNVYVVDGRGNRVVRLDQDYTLRQVYGDEDGEGALKRPQGVFVTDEGQVYVADTGNKRIVLFDQEGKFIREYKRPDSTYLPEGFRFEPMKLVVDNRGVMYLVLQSGYQGLMLMDGETGEFRGFFGMNQVDFNLVDMLKRRFFTEAQMSLEGNKLPGTISNVTIDEQGLLYTSSVRVSTRQLKKLNYSGTDLLGNRVYGDRYLVSGQERFFTDLAVDAGGNISAIDGQSGVIYQYDSDGNILFAFGGKDEGYHKLGLLGAPAAIEVDSKQRLYVVDNQANAVYVYRPTDFALTVLDAVNLTINGKYQESEQLWRKVLHLNSKYYLAHEGIGKSAYSKGQWEDSMTYFKAARAVEDYSRAYWHVRLNFMQSHFITILFTLVAIVIVFYAIKRFLGERIRAALRKYENVGGVEQINQLFRILRHPVDGFGELRYKNRGTLIFALALLVLLYVVMIASYTTSSFIFNPRDSNYQVEPIVKLLTLIIPFATWVVCNYLVSSIAHGQGRFVDVVIGSAYALAPYILFTVPIAVVSNAFTLGEAAIYHFLKLAVLGWTGFLFIVFVKETHNFDLGEAIRNIILTVLFAIALWVLIFIFFGMNVQLVDFISQIFEELKFRV
jgi:DNA-binding beta-propeller fold protein YncE